jgi:hypothetical protein
LIGERRWFAKLSSHQKRQSLQQHYRSNHSRTDSRDQLEDAKITDFDNTPSETTPWSALSCSPSRRFTLPTERRLLFELSRISLFRKKAIKRHTKDNIPRRLRRLEQTLMVWQRLHPFGEVRKVRSKAQCAQLNCGDVGNFVKEPSQEWLPVVGSTGLEMPEILRGENNTNAKFCSVSLRLNPLGRLLSQMPVILGDLQPACLNCGVLGLSGLSFGILGLG